LGAPNIDVGNNIAIATAANAIAVGNGITRRV
jgi:hypothetical protein